MKNKFENLNNGLTKIYCKGIRTSDEVEIYIDTVALNCISKNDVEWKVYRGEHYKSKEIKALFPNGKIPKLKSVIGEYFFGPDLRFSLIENNYTDLRLENIYAYPDKISHGRYLKKIKQELRDKLKTLNERQNGNIVNGEIQVIKYHVGALLIKDYKVIDNIEKEGIIALIKEYCN